MKTVHIIARNHMDPSWLRCFTDHYTHPARGDTVRPYADIEELQILEYMDFAELYGVKYQIEQSLTVKEFLRRCPDQKERFARLVKQGLLELAGGGEAVIDYNLTQGESWVRNHLYSRAYYDREFGVKPRFAITPDIFGLPSQLPQFFRTLGYDALIIFDRVLKNNKPFWKGLDGTPIVLDACFLQPPEPNLRTADCVKLTACPVCRGEGCESCLGTGLDTTYDMTRPDKAHYQGAYYGNMSADVFLETLLKTEKDEYFVMITAEEPRIGGFLYGPLREAAARHGVRVAYHTFEENHELWCPGQEERLRKGDFTENEIELRREGNPAGCGCYTSRIGIKQQNRALENLLAEAESMSVLALLSGGFGPDRRPLRAYPGQTLETLWNKMAFVQFHDCVTGTHCDASYQELLRVLREIRRGAYRIYADAAFAWRNGRSVKAPEGCYAAVLLNPTPYPHTLPVLRVAAGSGAKRVRAFTPEGEEIPAFDQRCSTGLAGTDVQARLACTVPAFGFYTVCWKEEETPEKTGKTALSNATAAIENAFFRVTADRRGITEIYDKRAGRPAFTDVSLAMGTDIGSVYGRSEPETDHRLLAADDTVKITGEAFERFVFTGGFGDNAPDSRWETVVTLYRDDPLVRFTVRIDSDLRDTRVFASFLPAFTHTDELWCEVPFGCMARKMPERLDLLGITDEWPTVGYAGVSGEGCNAAVLKGGLPAARLWEDRFEISLLRCVTSGDPTYADTNDPGTHIAEYALTAWTGGFADGNCSAKAAAYLTEGFTDPVTAPGLWNEPGEKETLPPCGTLFTALGALPAGLRLSALKRAENGDGIVVRFWESAGRETVFTPAPGTKLLRLDTLENPLPDPPADSYTFRPYEIGTFRLVLSFET